MKICELRHLDEIKGNFGIVDGLYYSASAKGTILFSATTTHMEYS